MKFINSPNEIIRNWYKGSTIRRDLFGRLKTTTLNPQFTYQNEYNKGDLQWNEKLTGTGAAAHDDTDATVDMTVSAASADDESTVEYSVDVNTYTGGTVIQSGFVSSGSGNTRVSQSASVQANYPLALDVDGANPTTLVIVARSFSGTANVAAAMGFEEVY